MEMYKQSRDQNKLSNQWHLNMARKLGETIYSRGTELHLLLLSGQRGKKKIVITLYVTEPMAEENPFNINHPTPNM